MLLNRRVTPRCCIAATAVGKAAAHCSAWRVFHKVDRTLRCHHCGFTERVPRACLIAAPGTSPHGPGTERLEEQLAEVLPQARMGRIDADVTKHKGALEAQLASVHAGEVDVLVGTQMVAKGTISAHHLVAAVNPDSALFASDFPRGRAPVCAADAGRRPGGRETRRWRATVNGCRPGTHPPAVCGAAPL